MKQVKYYAHAKTHHILRGGRKHTKKKRQKTKNNKKTQKQKTKKKNTQTHTPKKPDLKPFKGEKANRKSNTSGEKYIKRLSSLTLTEQRTGKAR